MPFNQAAGRKEAAPGGELQVASASSLRRSDRAVILPAGPPPVLLWQPVIIHRRDALSCRFQQRCKWTQMGSYRDQANNVPFISFAFFLFFSLYTPHCPPHPPPHLLLDFSPTLSPRVDSVSFRKAWRNKRFLQDASKSQPSLLPTDLLCPS